MKKKREAEGPASRKKDQTELGLGVIGVATAFAFAAVLAFATVVARFAAALSLTGILAFAIVLSLHGVVREESGRCHRMHLGRTVAGRRRMSANGRASHHARDGDSRQESFGGDT